MVNHKRVYRLYREEGLSLRLKPPRRHVSAADPDRQPAATRPNELWSMDFVSDALFDGRRLRALTVVDAYTSEALAPDRPSLPSSAALFPRTNVDAEERPKIS